MIPRAPFPRVLDNTMITDFAMCPRSFQWRFLQNLVSHGISIHLHTGSVVAWGLEHVRRLVYTGTPLDDALCSAFRVMAKAWNKVETDHVKDFVGAFSAVDYYFSQYEPLTDHVQPLLIEGVQPFEFSFVLPIDVKHPETDEPILICGRFDLLGTMGERKLIVDEKTCMQLGERWTKKWKLRSQFSTYVWGAQGYGHKLDTTIVRAICFRANGTFDTAEAVVFRPQWHIDMWFEQTIRRVKAMIRAWEENYFDLNLGETCTLYGGCPYITLCESEEPEKWLGSYKIHKWDPTTRPRAPANEVLSTHSGETE